MEHGPDFASAMTQLMDIYQRRREELATVQKQMTSATASVTSERRLLTVTVGAHGQLTKLTFNSRDYEQLGPKELARVIVETAAKAYEAVQAKVATNLTRNMAGSDFLPAGVNVADLLAGRGDPTRALPANVVDPALLQRLREARPGRPAPVREDGPGTGPADE
jgi:DNA-binding protein YbaB